MDLERINMTISRNGNYGVDGTVGHGPAKVSTQVACFRCNRQPRISHIQDGGGPTWRFQTRTSRAGIVVQPSFSRWVNRNSSRRRVSPTNQAAARRAGVPAGTRTAGAMVDRERCIRRFAPSVASTPRSLSGQLGTNQYIAVTVSVRCDDRPGRG